MARWLWQQGSCTTIVIIMMMMMTTITMTVEGVALKTEAEISRTKRSESSEAEWSVWFNSDRPWDGEGDFETTDNIQKTRQICPRDQDVVGAQCRVSVTNYTFDSSTTAFLEDRLLQACSSHGLICLNSQQTLGRCHDYQARFLCQASTEDGGGDSLFPNLDFRIYILLAAVPLLVIVLRLLWMCCCKAHVKRQRQLREQQRQQQRNSLTSGTLSSSSSQASFDSALANPPPPYTELFGEGHQPVFAISVGGECAGCGKCLHSSPYFVDPRGVSVSPPPPPPPPQPPQGERGEVAVTDAVPSPVSPGNDDVFLAAAPVTSQTPASSAEPVLRPSLPSSGSLQGAVAPPLLPSAASTHPNPSCNGTPSHCTCACHRLPTAHVNLAFRWDSSDPVGPSSPALLPGMHKPVFSFPRIDSTTSFTSYTSLPDYDEALDILKKSGLFLDEEKV